MAREISRRHETGRSAGSATRSQGQLKLMTIGERVARLREFDRDLPDQQGTSWLPPAHTLTVWKQVSKINRTVIRRLVRLPASRGVVDFSRFSSQSPGRLISTSGGLSAFVPHPLPPKEWRLSPEIWPLLNEATNRLYLLEGIGRTLPNPFMLLGPLIRRESILSSRIEGTYATPRQLLLFELHPVEPRDHNDPESDFEEVANYVEAFRYSLESQLPLSLRLIRDWHRILMQGVRGKDRTPGEFRRTQVGIGNPDDPRFVPPPPQEIGQCLDSFEKYINSSTSGLPPLIDCFLAHYQFETIHPFLDGNGRVGRLLLSTMIQIKSGLTKPWLHLSGYFERHRQQYVDRLFAVSAGNDWEGWIRLCLQATISQAGETIERCHNLQLAYRDFMERLKGAKGSIRLAAIVESLFSSPLVEPRALQRQLNVSYPTAQKDVDRLCDLGILELLSGPEFKTYWSRRVFEIAYAGVEPSPTGPEDSPNPSPTSTPPIEP